MKRGEFNAGDFLVNNDDGTIFIHDGYVNGDGYGCVIGMLDIMQIMKSKGYGTWMKGGNIRKATDEEIIELINRIINADIIEEY